MPLRPASRRLALCSPAACRVELPEACQREDHVVDVDVDVDVEAGAQGAGASRPPYRGPLDDEQLAR